MVSTVYHQEPTYCRHQIHSKGQTIYTRDTRFHQRQPALRPCIRYPLHQLASALPKPIKDWKTMEEWQLQSTHVSPCQLSCLGLAHRRHLLYTVWQGQDGDGQPWSHHQGVGYSNGSMQNDITRPYRQRLVPAVRCAGCCQWKLRYQLDCDGYRDWTGQAYIIRTYRQRAQFEIGQQGSNHQLLQGQNVALMEQAYRWIFTAIQWTSSSRQCGAVAWYTRRVGFRGSYRQDLGSEHWRLLKDVGIAYTRRCLCGIWRYVYC